AGVAIHVAQHEEESRCRNGHCGDDADHGQRRGRGVVPNFGEPRAWIHVHDCHRDADGQKVENEAKNFQPARDDSEFFAEPGALLLAAQADHPHSFVPRARNALPCCAHVGCHLLLKIQSLQLFGPLARHSRRHNTMPAANRAGRPHHSTNPNWRKSLGAPVYAPIHAKPRQTRGAVANPKIQDIAATAQISRLAGSCSRSSSARSRTRSWVRLARLRGTPICIVRSPESASVKRLSAAAQNSHSARWTDSHCSSI